MCGRVRRPNRRQIGLICRQPSGEITHGAAEQIGGYLRVVSGSMLVAERDPPLSPRDAGSPNRARRATVGGTFGRGDRMCAYGAAEKPELICRLLAGTGLAFHLYCSQSIFS